MGLAQSEDAPHAVRKDATRRELALDAPQASWLRLGTGVSPTQHGGLPDLHPAGLALRFTRSRTQGSVRRRGDRAPWLTHSAPAGADHLPAARGRPHYGWRERDGGQG